MSSRAELGVPTALQLVEEAFHLLRRTAPADLLVFYAGSVPFVLDLLYYTADRTRTGSPGVVAALGAGALYISMKIAQGRFARRLRASLGAVTPEQAGGAAVPVAGGWRHAAAQAETQPWSLFVLPVAFVLGIPFGWLYAYYQSLAVVGERGAARRHAAAWPRQNHVLILLLGLLGGLAFLNGLILLLVVPGLLHMLVGWQGAAALNPRGMLSWTTVAVALALAYLATAPLARAAYALRCFYLDARTSGDDLRAALATQRSRLAAALAVGFLLLAAPVARCQDAGRTLGDPPAEISGPAEAGPASAGDAPTPVLTGRARELDTAAARVLARREFAWRLPRSGAEPKKDGLFARVVQPVIDATTGAVSRGVDLARAALDWLARKLRMKAPPRDRERGDLSWIGWTHALFGLAAILVAAVAVLLVRRLRRRARPLPAPVATASGTLDVETDAAAAAALPAEQWVATARRLLAAGDARGAVRAAYLAGLALLAQRELLTPVRSKSNREYLHEVARRTRDRPEVRELFAASVENFERVWYGRHDATAELVAWCLATTAGIGDRLASTAVGDRMASTAVAAGAPQGGAGGR